MSAGQAVEQAALTLFSGPVGGVVGGREIGRLIDHSNRSSTSNGFLIIAFAPLPLSSFSERKPHSTPTG